jgi:hypothetical protein
MARILPCRGDGRAGVLPMRDVEVDVVRLQPRQALLYFVEDGSAAQVAVHGLAFLVEEMLALACMPDQPALGGDDGLLAAPLERLADQAFGVPQAIGRRGIDKPHAHVQGRLDGGNGSRIVPAAPHPAAHGPGAQADGFAGDAGRAQCCCLHRETFLTFMRWSTVTAASRISPLTTSCQ